MSVELDLIGETVGWGIAPFLQLEKVRISLIYEGYLDERKVMYFRLCPRFVCCSSRDIETNRMYYLDQKYDIKLQTSTFIAL